MKNYLIKAFLSSFLLTCVTITINAMDFKISPDFRISPTEKVIGTIADHPVTVMKMLASCANGLHSKQNPYLSVGLELASVALEGTLTLIEPEAKEKRNKRLLTMSLMAISFAACSAIAPAKLTAKAEPQK